jgi:hypothetical protein
MWELKTLIAFLLTVKKQIVNILLNEIKFKYRL